MPDVVLMYKDPRELRMEGSMNELALSEHDLAIATLVELYSEIPPPSRLVTGHFFSGPDYRVVRPDGVGSWCLIFTVAGTGEFLVGGERLELRRGDLVLVPPGTEHNYGTHGTHWETWWAHFQPRRDWHTWWGLPEDIPGLRHVRLSGPSEAARVISAFDRLHRDAQRAGLSPMSGSDDLGPVDEDVATRLILNGVEEVLLIAAHSGRRKGRAIDHRVQLVLDTISQDPSKPYTLTSLARLTHLSVSRLAHLFKDQVGETVMDVITTLRLERAAELLVATDLSVAEVARTVGYASPHYLSRQFNHRFGASPTSYRKERSC